MSGNRFVAAAVAVVFVAAAAYAGPPPAPAGAPQAAEAPRTLTIRADGADGNCYAFWRMGNCPQPHVFLDPNFRKMIENESPFVREVNAVYLLGGRWEGHNGWFLGVGPDGNVRTDFSGMIAELKGMIAMGLRPRIVLDNVPFTMSDPPQLNVYGNTAPPADERVWRRYVRAALEAMVSAFGRQTVAGWHFRVGTEPDLRPAHWAGTKEEWLAHYDYTVDAFTSVLPEGKIGPGNILNPAAAARAPRTLPATSAASRPRADRIQWGLDIIDHCAEGNNAATGGKGARMDHFSCSCYGRVGGSVRNFDDAMDAIRNRLGRYPRLAQVPVEVGEFAVLGDDVGRRLYAGDTSEWSASFYAAIAERVYAHQIESVYEWDHATGGVLHPRGQVIGMLERMADGRRLPVAAQADANAPTQVGAVACRKEGRILALLYHHRSDRKAGAPLPVRLEIVDPALKAGQAWLVSEWAIDANHAAWCYEYYADCLAAGLQPLPRAGMYEGSPLRFFGPEGETVFAKNRQKYLGLSQLPQTRRDEPLKAADGRLVLEMTLPCHSVRLLELSPVP